MEEEKETNTPHVVSEQDSTRSIQDGQVEGRNSEEKQISSMPGAFVDSPEHKPPQGQVSIGNNRHSMKPKGLFSQLSRTLGLDKNLADAREKHPLGGKPMEGFGSSSGQSGLGGFGASAGPSLGSIGGGPKAIGNSPGDDNSHGVTSPEALEGNLRNAITASKSWDSRTVFSQPQTHQVVEQNSYCDSKYVLHI